MATRKQLRQAIDAHLRLIHGSPTATRTATGGSTSTLVDTARSEADDYWNNAWLFISDTSDGAAPIGEEALVTDFVAATDTLSFEPAMTAAVGAGDTYELRRYFSAAGIHEAINAAIAETQAFFPPITTDETTVVQTDIYEYTLSSTIDDILRVDLLEHDVKVRGTATAGGASTLTDSDKSWTTNEWASYEVSIYDGTGAGQYRTIQSNTATALTVSAAWTTEPDETSKYLIKDVSETPDIARLSQVRYTDNVLSIAETLEDGQRLRVTYSPLVTEMDDDADETAIPKVLLVDMALYRLLSLAPVVLPGDDAARKAQAVARECWQRAEQYLRRHGGRKATRSWWNRGSTRRATWWGSSSPTIGTREEL